MEPDTEGRETRDARQAFDQAVQAEKWLTQSHKVTKHPRAKFFVSLGFCVSRNRFLTPSSLVW